MYLQELAMESVMARRENKAREERHEQDILDDELRENVRKINEE